ANTVLHVPLDIPHATAAPATNGLAGNYLYVFDMQGRQLMQQKVQPGNSTAQLDVSTLAPGTYSMVLVAEGYSISHQKFVVLR
ncbi:MAG: T9SS type A sorting domain-containing protein, partial [Bacteroidia bacterium]|nr:T9SS type A sorting domain-containing protein [Bacteroidia bacterium]